MHAYDHRKIEKKWQKIWKQTGLYKTKEAKGSKCYILDMFPYPSGDGLHVGHPKGYIATDVYSRMKRMQGYSILHPMGWDAFGLPAENYAIQNKIHPEVAVKKNIKRFKKQLELIGFNYDWSKEINTTDPNYYRWTQWIFLQMFHRGLVYRSNEPINWCPSCKTGLANEDLEDGRCERCGSVVEKKPIPQWVLRITDYADRLLADLDTLDDWPKSIKESQRNWIGRSEGAEISFQLSAVSCQEDDKKNIPLKAKSQKLAAIQVFTTRADTLFGATYLVLAPEHPFLKNIEDRILNIEEVRKYQIEAKQKTEMERTAEGKEKTGIELKGITAINPANGEEIPIWIADYVLADYGTGAIMAVPAHDERDFEFAKKFNLPVRTVVEPLLIDKSEQSKPRENLPFVERNVVDVIVKHWSENKYLCLQWKKVDWRTFVTGGIEEGQTPEEAARMEVQEETGYTDIKFIKVLGRYHSKFYHNPKKVNRFGHFYGMYFELQSDAQGEILREEKEKHDLHWINQGEVAKYIKDEPSIHVWRLLSDSLKTYTGAGILANSGKFDGLDSVEAKKKITEFVGGKLVTRYKLRDWVFSRQRYWGEPIPLVFCEECKKSIELNAKRYTLDAGEAMNPGWFAVPPDKLPVKLPKVKSYEPTGTGESPLAQIESFVKTTCPKCGGPATRETNTMPQWAGSCWYYLAYITKKTNRYTLTAKRSLSKWLPVDMYVGGAEHATRHLIYARFWHKFLFDIGVVDVGEPFTALHNVGLIQASDGRKMSKRYGNVINPDEIVERFGADSLRVYEMFMGPFSQPIAWNTDNLIGSRRFLERVWKLRFKIKDLRLEKSVSAEPNTDTKYLESVLHQTIKKVGDDILQFHFNTALSSLMILVNQLEKQPSISRPIFDTLLLLLAPFAPHLAEELWEERHRSSIHAVAWPRYEKEKAETGTLTIIVQVNGKVRGNFTANRGETEEILKKTALVTPNIASWIAGKEIRKTIVVRDRLVNIVV